MQTKETAKDKEKHIRLFLLKLLHRIFFVGAPLLFVKKKDTLLGLIMFDNGGERGTSRSVCDGNTAGKKNPTESKV